jgi:hypothetical protein
LGPSWQWLYGSWIYNYLCNQCLLPLMLLVRILIRARCTTLCHKVCQWHATGQWFSPDPPVSSANKTDRHDIAEILLKVVLNTIKQTKLVLLWAQLTKIYSPLPTSVQPISITKTLLIVLTKNERGPPLFTGKLLIKFQNILRNTTQVIIRHRVINSCAKSAWYARHQHSYNVCKDFLSHNSWMKNLNFTKKYTDRKTINYNNCAKFEVNWPRGSQFTARHTKKSPTIWWIKSHNSGMKIRNFTIKYTDCKTINSNNSVKFEVNWPRGS